jgi:hypothetical protein
MTNDQQTEGRLQQECFMWCWNERPETRGLLCYNLGNSKNRIDGNQNRSKGLIKGRADFSFYWSGKAYFIEMKTAGGRQHEEQKKWQAVVEKHGFSYLLCRDRKNFMEIIDGIIAPGCVASHSQGPHEPPSGEVCAAKSGESSE